MKKLEVEEESSELRDEGSGWEAEESLGGEAEQHGNGGDSPRAIRTGYLLRSNLASLDGDSILTSPWEERFVCLVTQPESSSLHFYQTELGRRARQVDVLNGCSVGVDRGVRAPRPFVFSVRNEKGEVVVQLATSTKEDADGWVNALVRHAGCTKRPEVSMDTAARAITGGLRLRRLARPFGFGGGSGNMPPSLAKRSVRIAKRQGRGIRLGRRESNTTSDSDEVKDQGHELQSPRGPAPYNMPASALVHRHSKSSILSGERLSYQRHSGLVNLATVILLVTHFRLILENLLKYGLRVHPLMWLLPFNWKEVSPDAVARATTLLLAWPCLLVMTFASLFLECILCRCATTRGQAGIPTLGFLGNLIRLLSVVNTLAALLVPSYMIYATHAEPGAGFSLIMITIILFLKLWSYSHANHDMRRTWQSRLCRKHNRCTKTNSGPSSTTDGAGDYDVHSDSEGESDSMKASDKSTKYPNNLTLGNFGYFIAAPTLCYQTSYPRTPKIRKKLLLTMIAELFIYLSLMMFLVEQYVKPAVSNSVGSLTKLDKVVQCGDKSTLLTIGEAAMVLLERVLKLSIPTMYVWLCGFYCLFHLWLNIVAELLRFGDRQFYKDWWNATTIDQYWRTWNMPVHKWMVRHLYFPVLRLGCGKGTATFIVFLFSAVFHELMVGLPLHVAPSFFRPWAFLGILLQLPLIAVTRLVAYTLKSEQFGNYFFWITFCIFGQPTSLLLYYYEYIETLEGGGTFDCTEAAPVLVNSVKSFMVNETTIMDEL